MTTATLTTYGGFNHKYKIQLLVPSVVINGNEETFVAVLNSPLPINTDIGVEFACSCKTLFVHADKINSTTISFRGPADFPSCEAKLSILAGIDRKILCNYMKPFIIKSKLDLLAELVEVSLDPMQFMASVFGSNQNDFTTVDLKLENVFRKKFCENLVSIKDFPSKEIMNVATKDRRYSKNPTLLHFAARYSLVKLCTVLLECPGASVALRISNCDGLTPSGLAKKIGNIPLAKLLSDKCVSGSTGNLSPNEIEGIYMQMALDFNDKCMKLGSNGRIFENDMTEKEETYEVLVTDHSNEGKKAANLTNDITFPLVSLKQRDGLLNGSQCEHYNTNQDNHFNELRRNVGEKLSLDDNFANHSKLAKSVSSPCRPNQNLKQSQSFDISETINDLSLSSEGLMPETKQNLYDVPPPKSILKSYSFDAPPSESAEYLYDTPNNRNSKTSTQVKQNLYDVPPNQHKHDFKATKSNDDLYDIPLSPKELDNFNKNNPHLYDIPSSKNSQNVISTAASHVVYDVPKSQQNSGDVYDYLPAQVHLSSTNGVNGMTSKDTVHYDVPTSQSHQRVNEVKNDFYMHPEHDQTLYDVPPSKTKCQTFPLNSNPVLCSSKDVMYAAPSKPLPQFPKDRKNDLSGEPFKPSGNAKDAFFNTKKKPYLSKQPSADDILNRDSLVPLPRLPPRESTTANTTTKKPERPQLKPRTSKKIK